MILIHQQIDSDLLFHVRGIAEGLEHVDLFSERAMDRVTLRSTRKAKKMRLCGSRHGRAGLLITFVR